MTNKIEQFLSEKFGEVRANLESVVDIYKNFDKDILVEFLNLNKHYNSEALSYVYFLKNESTGLTKIGVTHDLNKRIRQIKSNYKTMIGIEPNFKLDILIPVHPSKLNEAEKYFHKEYSEERKFGEWFNLEDTDDWTSLTDKYFYVNDTLIITDEFDFDKLNFELNFEIETCDIEKALNIKNNRLYTPKYNEILSLYFTCTNNKIGYKFDDYKFKNGFEKYNIVYFKDFNVYGISDIKKLKTDTKTIERLINSL